jgi:hypothetical protein
VNDCADKVLASISVRGKITLNQLSAALNSINDLVIEQLFCEGWLTERLFPKSDYLLE